MLQIVFLKTEFNDMFYEEEDKDSIAQEWLDALLRMKTKSKKWCIGLGIMALFWLTNLVALAATQSKCISISSLNYFVLCMLAYFVFLYTVDTVMMFISRRLCLKILREIRCRPAWSVAEKATAKMGKRVCLRNFVRSSMENLIEEENSEIKMEEAIMKLKGLLKLPSEKPSPGLDLTLTRTLSLANAVPLLSTIFFVMIVVSTHNDLKGNFESTWCMSLYIYDCIVLVMCFIHAFFKLIPMVKMFYSSFIR